MRRAKTDQRGQALVFIVVAMTVLLGMAALVLDVGSWFRADRHLQAAADAAALAGAQALPEDTGAASALAGAYVEKNGGPPPDSMTFSGKLVANDTVTVTLSRSAPGFFSTVLGIDSVQVGAKASARAGNVSAARWVAPIVVSWKHPLLPGGGRCSPLPCFGEQTELKLVNLHKPGSGDAAGAFGLLNLRGDGSGSAGASEVSDWMARGFDQYMKLGKYWSVPSAMFNSSQFKDALAQRIGDEVLFPIFMPPIVKGGSNAEYNIIGWIGFVPELFSGGGDNGKVIGYFTRVIWEGIQSESASQPDFGVRAIALVE